MAELGVQLAKNNDEDNVQPPNEMFESLEKKWNDKFSSLDEKMDALLDLLNHSRKTCQSLPRNACLTYLGTML